MAKRGPKQSTTSLFVAIGCAVLLAVAVWAFKGKILEKYTKNKTSCYGARGPQDVCKTCDSVLAAYAIKGWAVDRKKIAQCGTPCYGARSADDCETCDEVVNAYKAKGWKYDKTKFAQCKK
jgi:hypothetical protein